MRFKPKQWQAEYYLISFSKCINYIIVEWYFFQIYSYNKNRFATKTTIYKKIKKKYLINYYESKRNDSAGNER